MYSTEDEPADRETARSLFIGSGAASFLFLSSSLPAELFPCQIAFLIRDMGL